MSFSFFGWLRQKAKESVMLGLGDAIDELDADGEPADLDGLRKRLAGAAKQLAAKDEDEPGGKKRKVG